MLQTISPAQHNKTSIARAVLKEKLGGLSSLDKGKERTQQAVDWIYRWGWASASTLEILVGTERSGLGQRLVKNGLAISTKTISRRTEKYLPNSFLTLTEDGVHLAELSRDQTMQYELRPERVNQNQLLHDEMAQRATAERIAAHSIVDYMSAKELQVQGKTNVKNPDCGWIYSDGLKVSVEIELSPKWERDLDTFIHSSLLSLSNKNGPARFDRLVVVTDVKAIFTRYQAAFKPGAKFRVWAKNDKGRWAATQEGVVPEWTEERILWKLI